MGSCLDQNESEAEELHGWGHLVREIRGRVSPTSSRRPTVTRSVVKFEANGRWARVLFRWETVQVKRDVIYDLQADHVVDVISGDERDELQQRDP